ncbi:hypothetical protein [Bacillus sp. ISL-7]
MTYTDEELSIVCREEVVPSHVENIEISNEWRCVLKWKDLLIFQ